MHHPPLDHPSKKFNYFCGVNTKTHIMKNAYKAICKIAPKEKESKGE